MITPLELRVQYLTGKPLKPQLKQKIKAGLSTREIADALYISEASVRRYAKRYGLEITQKPINNYWAWR